MTLAADGAGAPWPLLRRTASARELWLVVAVVLTRLPFITPGFGRDGDAWLTIYAASRIAASGHYVASRLPGYPVTEYAYAALPWRTPLWTNGLTVVVTAVAAVLFYRLALRLGCRNCFLLSLAFVMTPVVYVGSATAMDYLWALALVLASLLLALRPGASSAGSPDVAGLAVAAASGAALGLATGARITSAVFVLELVPLLAMTLPGRRTRVAAAYLTGLVAAAALVWSPVLATYGSGFLTFYEQSPSLTQRVAHGTLQVWGLVGLLGLAAVLVLEARGGFARVRRRARALARDERWGLGTMAALLLAELAVFILLPHEAAYLIPAVPLVLLLAGRLAGRTAIIVMSLCLVVSPFVLNLDDYDFSRQGQDVRLGLAGPVLFDRQQRVFFQRRSEEIVAAAYAIRPGDVVLAGDWAPYGQGLAASRGMSGVAARVAVGLSTEDVRRLQAQGHAAYYLPWAAAALRDRWGLDPVASGLRPAPVDSP